MTLKEWIKESSEYAVKKQWLKSINKEFDRYYKYNSQTRRQKHIVFGMVERYNELYPTDKIDIEVKYDE